MNTCSTNPKGEAGLFCNTRWDSYDLTLLKKRGLKHRLKISSEFQKFTSTNDLQLTSNSAVQITLVRFDTSKNTQLLREEAFSGWLLDLTSSGLVVNFLGND